MRKSLWRTTLVLVVVFLLGAVSLPGCSTSSGFKMPETNWFSWGKKKPENTALASKPTTGLPAPPSTLTSPNTVPSYAPGSAGTSGYANNQYRGTTAGGTVAGTPSYGAQPGGANYYSNASYGGASGANRDAGQASQAYSGTGSSQGFYSPDYRGSPGPAGGTSAYARQSAPAGYGPGPSGDAYGTYGQSGRAANPGTNGQPWGQSGAASPAPYAGPAGTNYGGGAGYGNGSSSYGQASNPASAGGYDASGATRSATGYAGGAGSYGGSTYGGSVYGDTQTAPPQALGQESYSPAIAAGAYRPGSTARSTQFGTSNNLSVPSGESVQPASFAGAGQAGGGSPLSAPSPIGGSAAPQGGEPYPTRTATDGAYPSTYR